MKKRFLATIALVLVLSMALSGCAVFDGIKNFFQSTFGPKIVLTDAPLNAEKVINFANGADPDVLFESDGWSNGDVFNVVWTKSNVHYENGIMWLGITEEKATVWLNDEEVEFDYTAGEARTQNYYHYGDYAVSMKPSANPGTASTFFTCTGPYDTKFVLDANGDYVLDENGQRVTVENPHDEIDIEFLGKDTTKVQFNFFVNGKGGNEYMYDLGFDASEEFHEYGYRWTPNSITWFVDGEPVYKVTTDKSVKEGKNLKIVDAIPSTPGRILTNYWCGNEDAEGWMGKYSGNTKDNGTQYQWIATSAAGAPLNPPEQPEIDGTQIAWGDAVAPTFGSTDVYTVVTEGNTANVTYAGVGGSSYINVEMDIAEAAAVKNHVYLKVKNNGSAPVSVRVNVVDAELLAAEAKNASTNQSATQDGEAVRTDLEYGGSFFTIEPGQTSELIVKFNGVVEKLQLMLDSSKNDTSVNSGDITVEELKFAKVGEIEMPETPDIPDVPVTHPTSGDLTTKINDTEVTFGGNVSDGFGLNANDENNTLTVTYTNMVGDSYKNFWANVASIAGNKNIFTMKVYNPGTAAVKVRIDIESETKVNETIACNVSSTQDGVEKGADTTYGGSYFEIAPGATSVLEVTYNASRTPTNLKIYVDSSTYEDATVYAGQVVISEMEFKGEYNPDEGGEDGDDEPVNPPAPAPEFSKIDVEFKTENNYTLVSPALYSDSVRVTYTDIVGGSWNNINVWVEHLSAGYSAFRMKLTNHGAAQVSVWVQMKDAAGVELINENKNIAAGAEETFTFNYTGTAQMIYFFIDSTHEAAEGANSGDITISELKLGKVAANENPDEPADPEAPSTSEKLVFNTDVYTITPNNAETNTLEISYENIAGGTYANICANIAGKVPEKGSFTYTLKNTGDTTILVRTDIKATETVSTGEGSSTNICNTSDSGNGAWTDLLWGGTFINLEAGAEVTLTVYYEATEAFGPVTELLIYFDTSTYGDTNTYSGSLTISNFDFVAAE